MKKLLIVGSGGREHSLGWKLAQSPEVEKIFFAPGNGGTSQIGENVDIDMTDIEGLLRFAKHHKIDLTVVGQEAALELAIVDTFTEAGLKIFGPTKTAAQLETSKAFTADFMDRHGIPRPESYTAKTIEEALDYIEDREPSSYVIKADGLATGKGVVLPETEEESRQVLEEMMSGRAFGDSGKTVVFQERLHGQEVSAFALSDGKQVLMLPFFQDHKQAYDGDRGPNTGGMGAYSPVPFVTYEIASKIQNEVMQATIDGMKADGNEYRGVLYGGLFVTDSGDVKVIEFNARFGDPEAQVMMMLIKQDLLPLLEQSAEGSFQAEQVELNQGYAATVCLASGGYPGDYQKGKLISGLDVEYPNAVVFHAGTKLTDEGFVTNGGRVLNVTAVGERMQSALDYAYAAIGDGAIEFDGMQYRTDIGHRVL